MSKETLQEAVNCFGLEVVNEVRMIVEFSDPDGAYTTFEDQGMFEHAECVSMLYFEQLVPRLFPLQNPKNKP